MTIAEAMDSVASVSSTAKRQRGNTHDTEEEEEERVHTTTPDGEALCPPPAHDHDDVRVCEVHGHALHCVIYIYKYKQEMITSDV